MMPNTHKTTNHIMVPPTEREAYITVFAASLVLRISRQAVYHAIKLGRISAKNILGSWSVKLSSVNSYRKTRYDALHKRHNGLPVYDPSKGLFSIKQLAKILNISYSCLYHHVKCGNIPSYRVNACYVINCPDPKEFRKTYFAYKARRPKQKQLELNLNGD